MALRVYRPRWFGRALALLFLAFGCFFAIGVSVKAAVELAEPEPLNVLIAILFVLVGIGWTTYTFNVTVTLSEDGITHRNLLGQKRLPLNGIRGRRECVVRGGDPPGATRYLKLEPEDDRLPSISFGKNYNFDEAFYMWFNSLPDLDAMDKVKHKDSDFGLV